MAHQLWLWLRWQSLAIPTPSGASLSFAPLQKQERPLATVNLFIPHTQDKNSSDEDSSGKGNWAPPSRASPKESRALTCAPGHHAPRPAAQDRAETLKSAACVSSLGAQLLGCAVTRLFTSDTWGQIMITLPFTVQGTLVIYICSSTAESPRILLLFQASSGRKAV